ncbi:MAG: hypothetical protein LAT53_09385 [Idiomarina sp.]|nr:hypothetical protein [Idiomarina sp.]
MNAIDRFERWFGNSIKQLQELSTKDGAAATLMISIPLYERFVIAKLKQDGNPADEATMRAEIGSDLNLDNGHRRVFLEMFRNGFTHQRMAKDGKAKWMVSHVFGATPEFKTIVGGQHICLDP